MIAHGIKKGDAFNILPAADQILRIERVIDALNALGEFGPKAAAALPAIREAAVGKEELNARLREYVPRLAEKLTADLK